MLRVLTTIPPEDPPFAKKGLIYIQVYIYKGLFDKLTVLIYPRTKVLHNGFLSD